MGTFSFTDRHLDGKGKVVSPIQHLPAAPGQAEHTRHGVNYSELKNSFCSHSFHLSRLWLGPAFPSKCRILHIAGKKTP